MSNPIRGDRHPPQLSLVVELFSCGSTDIHRSLIPQVIKKRFPAGTFLSARHMHRPNLRHRFPMASHYETVAVTDTLEKTRKLAISFCG